MGRWGGDGGEVRLNSEASILQVGRGKERGADIKKGYTAKGVWMRLLK